MPERCDILETREQHFSDVSALVKRKNTHFSGHEWQHGLNKPCRAVRKKNKSSFQKGKELVKGKQGERPPAYREKIMRTQRVSKIPLEMRCGERLTPAGTCPGPRQWPCPGRSHRTVAPRRARGCGRRAPGGGCQSPGWMRAGTSWWYSGSVRMM